MVGGVVTALVRAEAPALSQVLRREGCQTGRTIRTLSDNDSAELLSVSCADLHGRYRQFTSNDGPRIEVAFASRVAVCIHVHMAGGIAWECIGTSRIKKMTGSATRSGLLQTRSTALHS
jgi:hypothetical protein